jgi:hypothetical protein
MADDVKVKFGGDFTNLSKGAEDAAKKAGTALSGWVSDFGSSIKRSLASALSLDALVSTAISNAKEHMGKMNELSILSKSLGVGSEDLQRFAEMGKMAGVSMDQMGRALQNANRLIAQASVGNKGSQEVLKQMGFTQQQVTSGQVKALDIVYKLGEGFKKNGNEVLAAAKATAAFGDAGSNMVDVLRQGNDAIRERLRLMQLYTEGEVESAARTQKLVDRGSEKLKYIFGGFAVENMGRAESESLIRQATSETNKFFGFESSSDFEKRFKNESGFKSKYLEKLAQEASARGVNLSEMISTMEKDLEEKNSPRGKLTYDPATIIMGLRAMRNEEAFMKQKQLGESRFLSSATPVLAASSLQQIGGGDVSSVTTGLLGNSIEDNTRRTADATEKIANRDALSTPSRASLINKAK